jgi:predicted DNA-binding transcriptional regulator YafY
VAQLAETLGVSKATCQRDLDLLGDLFHVRMEDDPHHSQRARYRMIGTFKPTIGAFPMRSLRLSKVAT